MWPIFGQMGFGLLPEDYIYTILDPISSSDREKCNYIGPLAGIELAAL